MKFYDCQTAPSPRRVRMFIAEKGLQIPTIEVNLRDGEQLTPAFLAINPLATVPVLIGEAGESFTTTHGCRAYLESIHPSPALLGGDAAGKGRVADLVATIEANGLGAVGETLRNSAKGMKDRAVTGTENYAQIPELAERGRRRVRHFLPVLDRLIGEQPFVAGGQISAADIDAFIFVEFIRWIKEAVPESLQHLHRWHQQMKARPSAAR